MTVVLKDVQPRKQLTIEWGEHVKGETVDVRCTNPDAPDDPSWRRADNATHSTTLSFPSDYSGEVDVVVTGDEGTSDTGTLSVD